jgi:hypothetical protein
MAGVSPTASPSWTPPGKPGTESNLNVVDADGKNSTTIASATHEAGVIKLLLIGWR